MLADQSIVLLRNDGTLPIAPATTATIAVIGPNADDPRNLFGDYSYAAHVETLLEMRDADNVFHVPIPDDLDLDVDVVGERTVFRRDHGRLPGGQRPHDPWLHGQRQPIAAASPRPSGWPPNPTSP